MAPYPELRIVITTASTPIDDLGEALPSSLKRAVIGSIQEIWDEFPGCTELSRCEQIQRYVTRHGIRSWLALREDIGDWPEEFRDNLVCIGTRLGLAEPGVRQEFAEKLERMHAEEFRRMTAQHDWTLNAVAANKHMEAAAQALADARSNSDDVVRLQAAGAAVFSCGTAIACAQSCRVTRVYGNEGLLVAFLGNALDWNRDRRSAILKLLNHRRVESQATARTPAEASIEVLGLAETTLEETRHWLANERENRGQ